MVVLRRQFLIPGHHRMPPLKATTVTTIEPIPFQKRPVVPDSRLSWKSTSHSVVRSIGDLGFPRSAPVYGLKRRDNLAFPRCSTTVVGWSAFLDVKMSAT